MVLSKRGDRLKSRSKNRRLRGVDGNFFAALVFALVSNHTVDQCIESVVFAHADVVAGMDFCTALAVDDIARYDRFTADLFDAKTATR